MNLKAYWDIGISLMGSDFVNNADYDNLANYFVLDSEYTSAFFVNGIIYFVIMIIIMLLAIRYAERMNNKSLYIVFIIYCYFLILNNGFFNLVINPFAIYLGASVWGNKTKQMEVSFAGNIVQLVYSLLSMEETLGLVYRTTANGCGRTKL